MHVPLSGGADDVERHGRNPGLAARKSPRLLSCCTVSGRFELCILGVKRRSGGVKYTD